MSDHRVLTSRQTTRLLFIPVALAAAALVAAGCGSSSKPAYCSDVTNLQNSVNSLKSVQLQSGAVSTLKTDVQKVQSERKRGRELGEAGLPEPDQRAAVIGLEPLDLGPGAAPVPDGPAAGSDRG